MSKLSDYSKFDHLDDSSSCEEYEPATEKKDMKDSVTAMTQQQSQSLTNVTTDKASASLPTNAPVSTTSTAHATPLPKQESLQIQKEHPSIPGRYIFCHNGNPIYEWEQSLEDVTLYVVVPSHVNPQSIYCEFQLQTLQVGMSSQNRKFDFIHEQTFGKIKVSESSWFLETQKDPKEEVLLTIVMMKLKRGEPWDCALQGTTATTTATTTSPNPVVSQAIQKQLMLERFQEEHPGMDFRNAEFNGEIPNPQTFMGGVNYQ